MIQKYDVGGDLQSFQDYVKATVNPRTYTNPVNDYNIYEDPKSYQSRDAHKKSLHSFIKKHPVMFGIKTADFEDFFSKMAGIESGYRPKAGRGMTYSGYYGLKGGRKMTPEQQHKQAFRHLSNIFNNQMVSSDVEKGKDLGFTPAQLLAKYWNQGNRVTNHLYNHQIFRNTDTTDGLGSTISEYGNNIDIPLDYSNYLHNSENRDSIKIEKGDRMSNIIKDVRRVGVDYSNRDKYFEDLNKKYNSKFNPKSIKVGDTLFMKRK